MGHPGALRLACAAMVVSGAVATGAAAVVHPAGDVGWPQTSRYVQKGELLPAKLVIMHEPGVEVALAGLHPSGALFERPVSVTQAAAASVSFRQALQGRNIDTVTVREALIRLPRAELTKLAEESLTYSCAGGPGGDDDGGRACEQVSSPAYKLEVLSKRTNHELVDIVLLRPTVELQADDKNTGWRTIRTSVEPMGNMVFTRDQQIVTDLGVVMGRMNSHQRSREVVVMENVFRALGIPIIGHVEHGGFLEGGDFVPLNESLAFLGRGLRTNAQAVKQVLENRWLGYDEVVVVVDDTDKSQDRMHLDTVFAVLDARTVLVLDMLDGSDARYHRQVAVYRRSASGRYVHHSAPEPEDFVGFLRRRGFHVVFVTSQQQQAYMANLLNLGVRSAGQADIITVHRDLATVVKQQAPGYSGVIEFIDYSGITAMYGAAHCTTQVFRAA